MPVVRRAKLLDAQHLANIHEQAWLNAYRGILPGVDLARAISRRHANWWEAALRQNRGILVLEANGTLAGYSTFGPTRYSNLSYEGEVYEFYILPTHQGLGFGRHFFSETLSDLAKHGLSGVITRVLTANEPAIAFYKAMGGREVGQSEDRFGRETVPTVVFAWPRHGG
ncbi:MAG: GNAT family N-acetyltransferase [Stappiaceae bacterium]